MSRFFNKGSWRQWLFWAGLFWVPLLLARPFLTQSLWTDEASSVWFARLPLNTLLTQLCDPHPPGYYTSLKLWLLAGEQEFWLRLPSLLAILLSAALIYRLGREAGSQKIGGLAALLLAWHPLQIWYAAEVRMYASVQLLGLVVFWLGWRFWTRGKLWDGLLYAAAASFGLWLDYSALFAWGLLQLWWLIRERPRLRAWIGLQTAVLLITLLLAISSSQVNALGQAYQPIFLAIQARRLGLSLEPEQAAPLLRILALITAAAGFLLAWGWPRWSTRFPKLKTGADWLWLAGWLFLLVITAVPRLYTVKRLVIVLLPYLALLTAYALSRWPKQIGRGTAVLGLFITALILPAHERENWRLAVEQLAPIKNEAAVIWVDDLIVPAYSFYAQELGIPWQPLIGSELPDLPAETPEPGETLRLITSSNPYRPLTQLLPPVFYMNYELVDLTQVTGVQIYSYRRRLQPDTTAVYPTPTPEETWSLLLPSPLAHCPK